VSGKTTTATQPIAILTSLSSRFEEVGEQDVAQIILSYLRLHPSIEGRVRIGLGGAVSESRKKPPRGRSRIRDPETKKPQKPNSRPGTTPRAKGKAAIAAKPSAKTWKRDPLFALEKFFRDVARVFLKDASFGHSPKGLEVAKDCIAVCNKVNMSLRALFHSQEKVETEVFGILLITRRAMVQDLMEAGKTLATKIVTELSSDELDAIASDVIEAESLDENNRSRLWRSLDISRLRLRKRALSHPPSGSTAIAGAGTGGASAGVSTSNIRGNTKSP